MLRELNSYREIMDVLSNTKSPKTKKETLSYLKQYATFNTRTITQYLYTVISKKDNNYVLKYIKPYISKHSCNNAKLFPELYYGAYVITNNVNYYTIPDYGNMCIVDNKGDILKTLTNNNPIIREILINLINFNLSNKENNKAREKVKTR